ncbi:MAG TPA: PepSY-like domain-containing protein [Phycisphaerae bacterium]|nr:PepSY-like domain-containing protein [Phycisphaerae bacterium]
MRKTKVLLPMIGLGVVGALAFAAWAAEGDEQQVTLDQVPAAVKATILKESAGAKITGIERETKNGKTIYDAEFLLNGKGIEIKVAPDGTLLGREAEDEGDDEDGLTIDQVPEPARAALLKLAGGATIVKAEREREHGVLVYGAKWVVNSTQHGAAVTAEGKLIETEETVRVEDLPPAVRTVVAKHFPAKTKLTIEKKMVVTYEVEARIDGTDRELVVFPTGKVHEEQGEDNHDDDDDAGGDDREDDD